jgi:hypothetical protein
MRKNNRISISRRDILPPRLIIETLAGILVI